MCTRYFLRGLRIVDKLRLLALASLLLLCMSAAATANPSDKQPFASLDVHGQKFAPELLTTAQKLAEESRQLLEKILAAVKDNKLARLDPTDVGKAHVLANRLARAADQLAVLGEPAGAEYRYRAQELQTGVGLAVVGLRALPGAAQGIANAGARARQISSERAQQLPKLEKLVARKDWDTAENELYEVYDAIDLFAVYLRFEERDALYSPWRTIETAIVDAMKAQRKAAAVKVLNDRAVALKVDFETLPAQLTAATDAVGKSGKHTIDGKELTGPQLVAHFDTAWQKLQVQTLNALAIEWARLPLAENFAPSAEWDRLRSPPTDKIITGLQALIAADCQRAKASEVADLYRAYLPAVADLVDHLPVEQQSQFAAVLVPLLKKSSELQADVAAYQAATTEVLRWRERVAQEQATRKLAEYPDARPLTRTAFTRRMESNGFFEAAPSTLPARMYEAVGKTLVLGTPNLVGKPVHVTDVVALGGSSQAGIARYEDRIYARVTLPQAALAPAVTALEDALHVNEQQGPLSLAATRAVRGAKRGDLVAAGGAVGGLFVEGHITRFATLPEAAALLLPLGQLPADYREYEQLEQVILRLDLKPRWAQQRYLFVEVTE